MIRRLRTDEQGNLIVAMGVILVVVMLLATLSARTIANLHAVSHLQNFAGALANADAGVTDAEYQLSQGSPTIFTNASGQPEFCVGPNTLCLGSGATTVPSSPGTTYKAVQVNPNKWVIQSVATVHGRPHAVRATLENQAQYPWALYGNTGLTFNGNNANGFGTYNSSAGDGAFNSSGVVQVGTNGSILCNGGLPSNVMVTYAPGGSEGGCTNFTQSGYNSVPVVPPPAHVSPGSILPCPGVSGSVNGVPGMIVGSLQPGAPASLGPGIYVCNQPLEINGTLTMTGGGPAPHTNCADPNLSTAPTDVTCIWVQLSGSSNNNNTTAIAITPGSHINQAAPLVPSPVPVAASLQLFSNSVGQIGGLGSRNDVYYFAGILDAPQAYLTQDGCSSVYYGSVTANTITCNGAPHLTVYYDAQLSAVVTPWAIGNYVEIGSNLVTIP